MTDDPDRHRIPQPPVASYGRDVQFFCCCHLIELVARPCGHRCAGVLDIVESEVRSLAGIKGQDCIRLIA